eukprot:TRINITY_DN1677_c0_g1_i1.p1 TRINITY_DN1677_c0_g1~~TRINITY_DN1677_c0_g1_i1.p1  ORF type:complete len:261 (+),score=49.24 TRINITY_DN1677_c0_g1_i1:52-834(+)
MRRATAFSVTRNTSKHILCSSPLFIRNYSHKVPELIFEKQNIEDGNVVYYHSKYAREELAPEEIINNKPNKKTYLTREQIEEVKVLRSEGWSVKQLSEKYSVAFWQISNNAPLSANQLHQLQLRDKLTLNEMRKRRKRIQRRGETWSSIHHANQAKWKKMFATEHNKINNWILKYNIREDPRYAKESAVEKWVRNRDAHGFATPHVLESTVGAPTFPKTEEEILDRWKEMGYQPVQEDDEDEELDPNSEEVDEPPPKIRL